MEKALLADTLLPQAADAIAQGVHSDPFSVLGMHPFRDGVVVRAFAPYADAVTLLDAGGQKVAKLREGPGGLFVAVLENRKPFPYRLRFTQRKHEWVSDDPYRFGTMIGELDVYLIAEGKHQRLYEVLGAHQSVVDGVSGTRFAVWAPNAKRVSVVGDFNGWDGRLHVMRRRIEAGLWEIFIPGLDRGIYYKFEIIGAGGELLPLKTDPFTFASEVPPQTSSITHGLIDYPFDDGPWMSRRAATSDVAAPISIYEVHLGSWRRKGDGATYLDYDDLGRDLIAYVKDMAFTHLELMPVSEHPFSGSWGYQPIGLYAPTSRFGTPAGFARFVEAAHKAGIGVIIDWVPAHFPTDAHGLGNFDGTPLYEHADPREGFHKDWNTLIYNLGRNEVANFLEANALFWLDRYHVDGLRVDAVASMLYRDYSRSAGEWVPNAYGGRENLEAIAFFRTISELIAEKFDGAFSAAEESTAFPGVSRPVNEGGLGFNYKWNMGWMHDTLQYMQKDPYFRKHHHDLLTFGLVYAFSENFILPLSHDEVVHGKGSLIGKMPGDSWQKFANLRAYFTFMWTHPGKKLLFMGGEFAQVDEWNYDQSLDWHLLDRPEHSGVQALVRDLNRLYCTQPALHEQDCAEAGFQWIDASDVASSIYVYARFAKDGTPAVIVLNMTPVPREAYRIGLPRAGDWREAINSDAQSYGGSNMGNSGKVVAAPEPWHGQPASAVVTLPPLAAIVLLPD